MRIPRDTKPLFLILILVSISFPLLIDGTPAQEEPVAVYRPTGPDPASRPTVRLVTAMDQARTDFKQRLQELTARYHATPDLEQRRLIQLEISDLKLGIETEIMAIQLRHARDLGLEKEADEIAARLAVLATPATGEGGDDHED